MGFKEELTKEEFTNNVYDLINIFMSFLEHSCSKMQSAFINSEAATTICDEIDENRETRRMLQKQLGYKQAQKNSKQAALIYNSIQKIMFAHEYKQPITEDQIMNDLIFEIAEFGYLLKSGSISCLDKTTGKKVKVLDLFKDENDACAILFHYFIKLSKRKDNDLEILKCFNDDAYIIPSEYDKFYNIIRAYYSHYESKNIINRKLNVTHDSIISLILLKVDKLEVNLYHEKRRRAKQLEEIKKEEKHIKYIKPSNIKYTPAQESQRLKKEENLAPIIDFTSEELKDKALDLPLEDLRKLLRESHLFTKKKLYEFEEDYKTRLFDRNFEEIKKKLDKTQINKLNLILNDTESEIYDELTEIISSEGQVDDASLALIVETIERYNPIDEEVSQNINIVMMPFREDIDNDFEYMYKYSKSSTEIKGVLKHIEFLEKHSINELKASQRNAFHHLIVNYNHEVEFNPHRYGAKQPKIFFCNISVCEENKAKIKEIFKIENLNNILLVFGVGNVQCEQELDIYNRMQKRFNTLRDRIEYINMIFSTPFTEETLKNAESVINRSYQMIDEYQSQYGDKNNKQKKLQ